MSAVLRESVLWECLFRVETWRGDDRDDLLEVAEFSNLLMYGGASCVAEALIGGGTATAGQALTFFNNANAYIGAGDSSTAAVATQTDLQASTNKLRKAMDTGFPSHTDGVTSGAAVATWRSTFATADANFNWQEVALFNGSSGGRMLNRAVQNIGTKTSAVSRIIVATVTLA